MARAELEQALREAGGDPGHTTRLRSLLGAELRRGREELTLPRSGYGEPVTVAVAVAVAAADGLVAVAPVDAALRTDRRAAGERATQVAVALAEALADTAGEGLLLAGDHGGHLALALAGDDPELAALAFDEAIAGVDRLRARALVVPAAVLDATDLRPAGPPLSGPEIAAPRAPAPHEDPDPARRAARRILQRLAGMGKWGGYHTDFAHLARGFAGNERALAAQVGEALLDAGLLEEKPSVGQRHVYLNSRRAGEIRRLIDTGELPEGLTLPFN